MIILFLKALAMGGLLILLPLCGRKDLVFAPAVLITFLSGIGLYVMKPPATQREMLTPDPKDRWSALFLYGAGILSFLLPILELRFFSKVSSGTSFYFTLFGLAFIFAGLGFRFWAIQVLGESFTAMVQILPEQTLIRRGPYRWIRHPSYLGALSLALGISILLKSWAGFCNCMLIFLPCYHYRITIEERTLHRHFRERFEAYARASWRLFPFLY